MSPSKLLEVKVERTIPASVGHTFDAWLNPGIPGNPWNAADKLLFDPRVDGFFYWTFKGTPHYGRFTEVQRPSRLEHTWMSPSTAGLESTVTVTFTERNAETVMTLVHSGLPDTDGGRSHERGWNYFLDLFRGPVLEGQIGTGPAAEASRTKRKSARGGMP